MVYINNLAPTRIFLNELDCNEYGGGYSNEGKDVFSFEFFRDIKEEEENTFRCESMSPLYDNGDIKMEEVVDYMWNNDRSGVFDFNTKNMIVIERKEMFIRFFVEVKNNTANESELGTETIAQKESVK